MATYYNWPPSLSGEKALSSEEVDLLRAMEPDSAMTVGGGLVNPSEMDREHRQAVLHSLGALRRRGLVRYIGSGTDEGLAYGRGWRLTPAGVDVVAEYERRVDAPRLRLEENRNDLLQRALDEKVDWTEPYQDSTLRMIALAWEEGYQAGVQDTRGSDIPGDWYPADNPYRPERN